MEEAPQGGAMSDDELAGILAEHETRAIGYYESEIASEQADALDRYYRRPYGDERKGRSQVVDATVAITVDNALAAVLKPFVSTDETVSFEPRGKEDEEVATQATEYVNYVLHQDNCGFLILHDWFKDALLQKVGVIKCYWEDKTRSKPVRLDRLDAMQLQTIMQEEKVIGGPYGPDEDGLYTLDILHTEPDGRLCVENVPPEEYRISPWTRPGRTPPYEAHVTVKARSELVEMGFDKEVVESLSKANNTQADSRHVARYEDESFQTLDGIQPPGDASREMVDFNDEFVLVDYDGDGVSELRRVMRSGNVILYNEEVEYGVFARLCPCPMPHKIYGLSLADMTIPEQRINTALIRQGLDNIYLHNNPRPIIGEGFERDKGQTMDEVLSDLPGAIIRARDVSQHDTLVVPFIADKAFGVIEQIKQKAEARTGISLMGQGMDPEAIDTAGQMSATQAAIMEDGRNTRAEMIARVFAETGVKDLFKIMLKMLAQHQPRARMIRLRNKWVEMDPREWNSEMDVSISVGLGLGNKAEQLSTAQAILELYERLGPTPFGTLIDKEKVYNAVKKFLNAAGIKNVDDFVNEPQKDAQGNVIPDPPQPDPETMKAQAELQMKQADLQAKQAEAQAKLQMAQQQAALDAQLARDKAAADLELQRQKAQAEIAMNEQRLQAELALAERKMAMQERTAERDAARKDAANDAKLSANREGGSLAE